MSDAPEKAESPIYRCPKCGSRRGWTITFRLHETYTGPWGNPGSAPPERSIERGPENAKCLKCGALVEKLRAIGVKEPT